MEINGLKLPAAFVQDIQTRKFRREIGCWKLNKDFDAYGNPLETEIGVVYENTKSLSSETESLWRDFINEDLDNEPNEWENEPSYIPYIKDFTKIICFAAGGDGSPFCFDFRANEDKPSIIWWADAFWLRIAPDYNSFFELFDFNEANN